MTAPRSDSQPNTGGTFEEKLARARSRDPLDEVEQARRRGWPDRWPASTSSTTDDGN